MFTFCDVRATKPTELVASRHACVCVCEMIRLAHVDNMCGGKMSRSSELRAVAVRPQHTITRWMNGWMDERSADE